MSLEQRTDASEVELPSFSSERCYVHVRIPPCTSMGHRADHWNVTSPDYTCILKPVTKGDMYIIRLFDLDSSELFAEAFWQPGRQMSSVIEPVADSSRYFALRIEEPGTNKHVFVGIGFHDRDEAGQLRTSLYEHARYLGRLDRVAQEEQRAQAAQEAGVKPEQSDMSLKAPVTIPLPGRLKKAGHGFLSRARAANTVVLPDIKPLSPSATYKHTPGDAAFAARSGASTMPCGSAGTSNACGDDEFGDFVG